MRTDSPTDTSMRFLAGRKVFRDITPAAKAGDNEIVLDVTNTAQARWQKSSSHGDALSGLFGPVRALRR